MKKINEQQNAASQPDSGVSLIIAGAGTGKTSTMITKIRNIIDHSIVKPEEILILTFSKKAAEEIVERLSAELSSGSNIGFAGTFHAFSLKLLKENGSYYLKHRGIDLFPSIIGQDEKYQIIKMLIRNKPERFLGLPADAVINLLENLNHLDKQLTHKLKSCSLFDEINILLNDYETYKRENLVLEFEDIIEHASEILETYPDLKFKITDRYKYVFVDEFQDTSDNNFRLLSLLLPDKNKNIFMVGDDYQSIYKFRHSRIEYIINAEKFFPGIRKYKLTVNYRSKSEIISISNRFIRLNKFRTSKKISSHRGKGGKVNYHTISDMHQEYELINRIASSASDKSTIAVLYRNNYQGDYLKKKYESENRCKKIEFMTMHGSKGLEFNTVIIAGISDKIIPDRTSDIEEERRLFYVALTRAMDELHLLYYTDSNNKLPRFVRETGYRKK